MITPKIIKETTVVLGPCRLSYTHLLQRHSHNGEGEGKYSTNILIPKSAKETVAAVRGAIEAAKRAGVISKWGGKEPKKLELALRDGDVDREDDPIYAGHYFLNAKASTRPGVVDRDGSPIVDEEEVYSGMWALVSVSMFPYDVNGNRGVACGLNNVKKWRDGERLGGRASAESDFAGIDLNDDDDTVDY